MSNLKPHYFLGEATPSGFQTSFGSLMKQDGFFTYILKGGPGTGKSSLMKRLGAFFEAAGRAVEYYHCASDPDSLDAVVIPDAKAAVVDGTSPQESVLWVQIPALPRP